MFCQASVLQPYRVRTIREQKKTIMPTDLITAYQNTNYIVQDAAESFTLKVNSRSKELNNLYQKNNKNTAAFISAFNPYSQVTSVEQNIQAHTKLSKRTTAKYYTVYQGYGVDPTGEWTPEKSLLLLGISFLDACQLGIYFQQNAILFADKKAIPRLIFF